MSTEVIDTPFHVRLVGKRGVVPDKRFGETGKALMDELWAVVRDRKLAHRGINHWVYLSCTELFTGVELSAPADDLGGLETWEVTLPRYLRAVHRGPYTELSRTYADLDAHFARSGERSSGTSLEIYGHWDADPAKMETTVLIGLEPVAE